LLGMTFVVGFVEWEEFADGSLPVSGQAKDPPLHELRNIGRRRQRGAMRSMKRAATTMRKDAKVTTGR